MAKIAIVGGNGFIGRSLVQALRDSGCVIRIIDIVRPSAAPAATEYVEVDVRNLLALTEAVKGCDVVVNLAAVHADNVRPISLYHDVNVTGANNVCAAADANGVTKIIFTSSVAIYGFQPGMPDENSPPAPFNEYGRTKWQAEEIFRNWYEASPSKRRLTIVRPVVIFGFGNRANVYRLIKQLHRRFFLMIGDGGNSKSVAYVENIAAFLTHITLTQNDPGYALYNYGDKPDVPVRKMIALLRGAFGLNPNPSLTVPYNAALALGAFLDGLSRIIGYQFPLSKVRVEKFCADTIFAADKMKETGFVPPHKFEDELITVARQEFPGKR